MSLLKKLDRKLGRFAIHNLTLYLVGGQGLALLLGMTMPGAIDSMLLVPADVMAGEWWRLLAFVLTPPSGNVVFAAIALYFLYFMGGSLESHWGAFRYNLYVLIGYLMTIAAAFAFPFSVATNVYITGSIFLAFAYLYPDFQILLFLIIPVRVKWLALLTWIGYGYGLIFGDWPGRLQILAAIANFLAFFGADLFYRARYGHRKLKKHAAQVAERTKPTHACTACGVTDKSDKTMDFRYCTRCDPPREYCMRHLQEHEHVREAG